MHTVPCGDSSGIWTRDIAVTGQRFNQAKLWNHFGGCNRIWTYDPRIKSPLLWPTELYIHMEHQEGLEPSTYRLQGDCTTFVLLVHNKNQVYPLTSWIYLAIIAY